MQQTTHYDTLKVSRDAPIEVIRAAYRVLSQRYHPDRHPADPDAVRTMGLLNEAYAVLSDAERREAHDAWIHRMEGKSSPARKRKGSAPREARVRSAPGRPLQRWGILCASVVLGLGIVLVLSYAERPQTSSWVAVPPAPEDREAYIRQMARDVMLPRSDRVIGSAPVPSAADAPAPGSGNPTREADLERSTAAAGASAPSEASPASATVHAPAFDGGGPAIELPFVSPLDEGQSSSFAGTTGAADPAPASLESHPVTIEAAGQ